MLCDLNIPWPVHNYDDKPSAKQIQEIKNILALLCEIGYTHIALNFELDPDVKISTKTFASKQGSSNPINLGLFKEFKDKIKIFTRVTLTVDDVSNLQGLKFFNEFFDILAVKPLNEKALSMVVTNLEINVISFDYTKRLGYWLKNKTAHSAVAKEKYLEVVYAPLTDSATRVNFLSLTKNVVRATRGNGIIVSSGAKRSLELKSRNELANLLSLVNVKANQIADIFEKYPMNVLLAGKLRLNSYKQTVSIGGELLVEQNRSGKKVTPGEYKRRLDPAELEVMKKLKKA